MNCTMNKRIKIQLDRMEQMKAHNDKKKKHLEKLSI